MRRRLLVAALLAAAVAPAVDRAQAQPATPTLAPTQAQALPLDAEPLCGDAERTPGSPSVVDDGALTVVTMNLLHSETEDGDASLGARLPLLADAIVDAGADLVGAQEVTRNIGFDPAAEAPQKHGVVAARLAEALAARTGETWSWCWSLSNPHVPGSPDIFPGGGNPLDEQMAASANFPDAGDFSEGLAVLSRFPIERASFRRLLPRSYEAIGCVEVDPFCSLAAAFDSRQVLFARVAAPGGGVDMFTTHVAHHLTPLSDQTKLLQAQQIVAITEELSTEDTLPDVLVGDFNSAPSSDAMATVTGAGFVDGYLAGGGQECAAGGAGGCSGGPPADGEVWTDAPDRPMSQRIDYVLLRPPAACELSVPSAQRVADAPTPLPDGRFLWPSDHYGFAAEVACTAGPAGVDGAAGSPAAPPGTRAGTTLPATGGEPPWALLGLVVVLAWAARRVAVRAD